MVDDKAHYYPDAGSFIVKLIADRSAHKLLGLQVLGPGAVDKMVDIAVTALSLDASGGLSNLDYAYAPPFSTAIHPFVQAVYILLNKLSGEFTTFTPAQYAAGEAADYTVLDVGLQPSVPGAVRIDLSAVNAPSDGLRRTPNSSSSAPRANGATSSRTS